MRFGSGPKVALAFHGFGRSYHDYQSLAEHLGDDFTIIGCNLFLHGNSLIPEYRVDNNPISVEELGNFFAEMLNSIGVERFSLIGYSLGGNIALSLFETLHARVDNLLLFAPDGIRTGRWYHFVSRNWFGRRIYKRIVKNPKPFFGLVKFLNKIGLISDRLKHFVLEHMQTQEQRELVYNVWNTFRRLKVNVGELCKRLDEANTKSVLVFGNYDRVIQPTIGEKLQQQIKRPVVHYVDFGHLLLDKKIYEALNLRSLVSESKVKA